MGYYENTKGYRFIKPKTRKFIIARDAIFLKKSTHSSQEENEEIKGHKNKQTIDVLTIDQSEENKDENKNKIEKEEKDKNEEENKKENEDEDVTKSEITDENIQVFKSDQSISKNAIERKTEKENTQETQALRRSQRERKPRQLNSHLT